MSKLNVICACCRYGQRKLGVEQGPIEILQNIVKNNIINASIINKKNFKTNDGYMKIYNEHLLMEDERIITLGGDHSISAFSIASSLKKYGDSLKILWIDAHADINTRNSSLTKNTHGMPVASIIGLDNIWEEKLPIADKNQLTFLGLRDVDDFEKEKIKELNIESYWMKNIHDIGFNNIVDEIKKNNKNSKFHISFDVDSLDPKYAPATGTPVADGLSVDNVKFLINSLKEQTVAYDIVEYNPLLNLNKNEDLTLKNINEIINEMF